MLMDSFQMMNGYAKALSIMDLIEIRSINGIEMNNNTYTEVFNTMDCDNDFAVNFYGISNGV